ncbi:MAG: YidC/Oxa1 family membrane protein insertase [Agathobaculum sp.]|jgi:YidC/Oxa1 family membrane protein insertase|uniref:YidC/Oxa1 family membrane protein insertase n=1 Tax=Agathobaculum sp. TaxID=2048138 RepID=UPI003D8FAE4C
MGDIFGLLIVRPLGLILLAIFKAVKSYGFAVILFALAVKLVCIPLAIKGKKSMLAMTAMNNEMQQLQKKYANNRMKLNEEIQKLYDKHGVSPMSGCLPQFIPLPIMMGLYYAVQQPLKFMMGFGDEVVARLGTVVGVDVATAGYYGQITIAEKLGQIFSENGGVWPETITKITDGMGELLNIDFSFFGLNLAQVPSIKDPSIIWLIPILSGVTAYLSSYVMQKMQGTPGAAAGQMKMLNILMPLMSVYFGFILPGAIGIYWIFNNVFTCIQDIVLTKVIRGKQEKQAAEEEARIAAEKEAKRAAHRAAQIEQAKQAQQAKGKKGDK